MCVSALAIGMSEQWPVLIAGNRDEYLDRPTQDLHVWQSPLGHDVWGGRDTREMGSWFLLAPGVGACALVTNFRREPTAQGVQSRGQLPLLWVDAMATSGAEPFIHTLEQESGQYGFFNLVCGDVRSQRWWYLNNARETLHVQPLSAGVYGLSNGWLDAPWPKSERLSGAIQQALPQVQLAEDWGTHLMPHLRSTDKAASHLLPETGISHEAERQLSPVFIDWPQRTYGTRSSHLLAIDATDRLFFLEHRYPDHPMAERQRHGHIHSLSK
jgi:uncharacterized protein with NRDE domain